MTHKTNLGTCFCFSKQEGVGSMHPWTFRARRRRPKPHQAEEMWSLVERELAPETPWRQVKAEAH